VECGPVKYSARLNNSSCSFIKYRCKISEKGKKLKRELGLVWETYFRKGKLIIV
jgi:hypothetical protein